MLLPPAQAPPLPLRAQNEIECAPAARTVSCRAGIVPCMLDAPALAAPLPLRAQTEIECARL